MTGAGPDTDRPRFTVTKWRQGYDRAEVDAFLAKVAEGAVSPADVEGVRFSPSRFQPGYDEEEVDRALDVLATRASASTPHSPTPASAVANVSATPGGQVPSPYQTFGSQGWTHTQRAATALVGVVVLVVAVLYGLGVINTFG